MLKEIQRFNVPSHLLDKDANDRKDYRYVCAEIQHPKVAQLCMKYQYQENA